MAGIGLAGTGGRMMHGMFSRLWRSGWVVAVTVALGATLRVWFVRHPNPFLGDPMIYGNIARNLLTHHGYSFAAEPGPFPPTMIRLPGYPLFLALCFLLFGIGNFAAAIWIQVLVDLLACIALALLAVACLACAPRLRLCCSAACARSRRTIRLLR